MTDPIDPLAALAAEVAASEEEKRLHPILSNEEVAAARERGRARAQELVRKQAMKAIEEEALRDAQHEAGLVTGETVKDELVNITLDLAPHQPYIGLNSKRYYHAYPYAVPRHVADTLREIQARGWQHQDEIDGKDLSEHYRRALNTGLSPVRGLTNPPTGALVH